MFNGEIAECYNQLTNCPGYEYEYVKESFGNSLCTEGHIGALCEACDLKGEHWNE